MDPLKPRAMNEDTEEERCRLCLGGEEDGPLVQLYTSLVCVSPRAPRLRSASVYYPQIIP